VLGAFLLLQPLRPLFFWLAGEASGFQLFLAVRVAVLGCAIVVAARSTLAFDWKPRAVPIAAKGADPLLTLRGFACLIVLIGHGTAIVFSPAEFSELIRNDSPFRLAMVCPWLGVWIFFVLSGYLMGKGFYGGRYEVSRAGIVRFYFNRLLRIGPVYWTAILIVAAILARRVFQPENLLGFLSSLLFFQSNEMPFVVIGALWSVQTEIVFYLVVPFLFAALATLINRGARPVWLLAAFLAFGIAYRIAALLLGKLAGVSIWNAVICVPTIANIGLFATGILTNWLIAHHGKQMSVRFVATGICAALFVVGALLFSASRIADGKLQLEALVILGPTVAAILTSIAIMAVETEPSHGVFVRMTQWFGILTYSIYVVHEPIYNAVRALAPEWLSASQSLIFTTLAMISAVALARSFISPSNVRSMH
jgi:peptidoglycan/LPS O-acetylase OafA/YrhL